jgi:hypothetical protein
VSASLTIGRVLSTLLDSVKAVVRGGAKGATAEADVTSTSIDADHQALDVAVRSSVAIPISGTVTVAEPVSVDDGGGSITVDDGGVPLDVSVVGSVTVAEQKAATSSLTNVSQSAASVTLLAANAARVEAVVFNDGTKDLLVKLGATASASSFTFLVAKGGHVVVDRYTGIIDGIWTAAGGGAARVTELTP